MTLVYCTIIGAALGITSRALVGKPTWQTAALCSMWFAAGVLAQKFLVE